MGHLKEVGLLPDRHITELTVRRDTCKVNEAADGACIVQEPLRSRHHLVTVIAGAHADHMLCSQPRPHLHPVNQILSAESTPLKLYEYLVLMHLHVLHRHNDRQTLHKGVRNPANKPHCMSCSMLQGGMCTSSSSASSSALLDATDCAASFAATPASLARNSRSR